MIRRRAIFDEHFVNYIEIFYSFSNLRHLILSCNSKLLSKGSQLNPILNKQIQRLDIDAQCHIEQLVEANDD